jgi:hypothetical protein
MTLLTPAGVKDTGSHIFPRCTVMAVKLVVNYHNVTGAGGKFVSAVNGTDDKFVSVVNDAGSKFVSTVNDAGGKFVSAVNDAEVLQKSYTIIE